MCGEWVKCKGAVTCKEVNCPHWPRHHKNEDCDVECMTYSGVLFSRCVRLSWGEEKKDD